ncbi:PDZ domain-containing protein [Thermoanaerobacterium thermosaccharolyticum]|uniref:PDZ domain-containing protein n=1 Tax=Thermoanaerobacterium thermosaccharolyticum TaxID=1517 RepID=UPI00123A0E83|nr:PDZ domain-containing protein [Thermoanaerobacterium thermosaccharolyticum]KAA5808461.1 PDZ domain-containing protein [Thermoanaerobacterium thermosaccharolyticum]
MVYLKLIWLIVKSIAIMILNPFMWLVVAFIYFQYKKNIDAERQMVGKEQTSLKDQVLDSTIYGFLTGILGSIIIVLLGITIDNIGIEYVFPLAILLMLINPRYICFSYAGGIVSIISLITGFPNVNVAGLMAIVGILHLMESILIYIDGSVNSIPVFVKLKDDKVVGGYTMQKFWPIPFVALSTTTAILGGASSVNMPDWWPLLGPSSNLKNIVFIMMPVIAALGYGDIALTEMPQKRAKKSSKRLFAFSLILITFSLLGSKIYIFKWIAAIFGPLAHEMLIIIGQKEERARKPLFESQDNGLMVLSVMKNSPAEHIGLKPGDIILKINDIPIDSEEDIKRLLYNNPTILFIIVREPDGNYVKYEYRNCKGVNWLGVLVVPRYPENMYHIDEMENGGLLRSLIRKFRKKN